MSPLWSDQELERHRVEAIRRFVEQRLAEGNRPYKEAFGKYREQVEDLLEKTDALQKIDPDILRRHARLLTPLRYACAPPISKDDLETLSRALLEMRPTDEQARQSQALWIARKDVLKQALDPYRFPWLAEGRSPTPQEREAAVIATTSLWCAQVVATRRRSEASKNQQEAVKAVIEASGFTLITRREFAVPAAEIDVGEYSLEAQLAAHKADFVVRTEYDRVLAIECKVSNSATNSIKRINDVINKARAWKQRFGDLVTPLAILGGVFKLTDLRRAQAQGVYLVFDHDLDRLTGLLRERR